MKSTRLFLAALAMVATASCFAQYASPEVMLVTDFGDGGSNPAQIERYDPITTQYLGAFGNGIVGIPFGMAVSGQTAYVSDVVPVGSVEYSRIDKFNWSTGAYLGSIFDPSPYQLTGLTVFGNSLLASDFGDGTGAHGSLYTFDLTTGALLGSAALPNGSEPFRVTTLGNQAFVSGSGSATGGIYRYNLNANGTTNGSATQISSGTNSTVALAGYTNKAGSTSLFAGTQNASGSAATIERRDASGSLVDSFTLPPGHAVPIAFAFGHNGMMYSLEQGSNRIDRYDAETPLFLGSLGSFSLTNTVNASNIAVYAAPEPVTVLAFGIGVLALVRRRRRV